MNRLVVAAVLALGVHGALFWIKAPQTQPVMRLSPSPAVDINLVTFPKPVETPAPPKPQTAQPKPKTVPEQPLKPVPKRVVQPRTNPPALPPQPAPDPPPALDKPVLESSVEIHPEESATAIPTETRASSDEEHAAVHISVPLYDLNPPPVYPRVARRRHYQGTVLLDVLVTVDGSAAEVKLAQSSGYSVLDQSALKTVKQWRFEPARRGSQPIKTWVQVPVRFELK